MECNGNTISLKEQWKKHYAKKENIFKVHPVMVNKASICIFVCFTLLVFTELVFIIIPGLEPGVRNCERRRSWIVTVCLLFLEMLLNWYLTWRDNDLYVRQSTSEKMFIGRLDTPVDWHNCVTCQRDAPPRSHHCKLCQQCVLKRNHHCFITSSCVGFSNQRRYTVFCLYACITSIVAIWLQLHYANEVIGSDNILIYLPPIAIWNWFTGHLSIPILFILINSYVCLVCAISSGLFFIWEVILIMRGQTAHEAWKNINTYRSDKIFGNIRNVFGPYWLLQVIVPLPTAIEGDGCAWVIHKEFKSM